MVTLTLKVFKVGFVQECWMAKCAWVQRLEFATKLDKNERSPATTQYVAKCSITYGAPKQYPGLQR